MMNMFIMYFNIHLFIIAWQNTIYWNHYLVILSYIWKYNVLYGKKSKITKITRQIITPADGSNKIKDVSEYKGFDESGKNIIWHFNGFASIIKEVSRIYLIK